MPFNGSGVFSRVMNWVTDAGNSVPMTPSRFDLDAQDLANGLSQCMTRAGISLPTANLPMGGFRLTGLGAAVGAGDALNLGQLGSSTGAALSGTIYGGTVADDLAAARPVARGGTGATTAGAAIQNLGLIDINSSISVTGVTTLASTALGKCIVLSDSGSPANFVVTLPPAAPVGSLIMLRVSNLATKLYGINGNDVQIDGVLQRVLWAGEVALLLREANNWTKIGGKSRPFAGGLTRATSQTGIVTNTNTQVAFTGTFGDQSGLNLAYNSGTNNIAIPRGGNYNITGNLSIAGTSIAGTGALIALIQNSLTPQTTPNAYINEVVGTGATRFAAGVSGLFNCATGDAIGLIGNIGGGTSISFEATTGIAPCLTYQEVSTW